MKRRDFITLIGGAAAWPLPAGAQQASHMPRVGVLLAEDDRGMQARLEGLRQGLERLGWSDGRNIQMVYRFGEGKPDRFQPLAKELVAMQPDLIIAQTPLVVAAVRQETSVIPIVFLDVSDPIGAGFIANLARPGGNLTGLVTFEAGIVGKWLAMLKEIDPALTRVALVGNRKTTAFDYFLRAATAAAPSVGVELIPEQVVTASDIERVVESFAGRQSCIAISLSHSQLSTISRLFMPSAFLSPPAVSCLTASISFLRIGKQHPMSTVSCAVPSPPTSRCKRRPSSKLSSISKRRRRLA